MIRALVVSAVAIFTSLDTVHSMEVSGHAKATSPVILVKAAPIKPAFNKAAAPPKPTYKTPKPALKPPRARTPTPQAKTTARSPRASTRPSARTQRAKTRMNSARRTGPPRRASNANARAGSLRPQFNRAASTKPLKTRFNRAARAPLRATFNNASSGGPPRKGAWTRGGGTPQSLRATFRRTAAAPAAKPTKSNLRYRVNITSSGVVNPRSMITHTYNKASGASKTLKSQFRRASGSMAPKYLRTKSGQKIPLPKNAYGPFPTKSLKTGQPNGGLYFRGGPGNRNVTRLMPPTTGRSKAPAYPNGYFKHQILTRGPNGKISRQTVAGPNSKKTVKRSDPNAHIPFQ